MMYGLARAFVRPTILELGTQRGVSTTVFLQACAENDGILFSVDVDDCSSVSDDPRFRFVRGDSTNAAHVIEKAPQVSEGIDLLYVDSLHTRDHVLRELRAWWPYLKQGSVIVFDDIDPHNYRPGQIRDNVGVETSNEQIALLIEEVYRANMDNLDLQFHLGGSGKAVLKKHGPIGEVLTVPSRLKKRGAFPKFVRLLRTRRSHLKRRLAQPK